MLVRAKEILKAALREDAASGGQKYYTQMLLVSEPAQESAPSAVETRLREVNPDTMTPMQALMFISELKSLQEKRL